jgi:signal transduction histidine kinase
MLELRTTVLDEWLARVRSQVQQARDLLQPVLVDTFPAFYDNLVEALSPEYPRTSAAVANPSVALEHGGERARLTSYDAKSIILEYQLLKAAIFDTLNQHQVPVGDHERQIIDSSIDASIREAVTAFALAESAFREQFVAALAHDLRNPLSNARVAGQLILRTDDIGRVHGFAQKIIHNLDRMDQMIRELLDAVIFQHGERLKIHPVRLEMEEIIKQVCEQFESIHGPRFELQTTPVQGWWGKDELQRALENLIGNALKYGAPDKPIRIACLAEHGRVLLSVHNEGKPIPPEQIESVFQVFERAKAAKEGDASGWGIGLPYVRSVVESHGGSIDVDSSAERGTTFTIDIPVDARPFEHAPVIEPG